MHKPINHLSLTINHCALRAHKLSFKFYNEETMIMKRYSWMLLACLLLGLAACSDDKGTDTPAQNCGRGVHPDFV